MVGAAPCLRFLDKLIGECQNQKGLQKLSGSSSWPGVALSLAGIWQDVGGEEGVCFTRTRGGAPTLVSGGMATDARWFGMPSSFHTSHCPSQTTSFIPAEAAHDPHLQKRRDLKKWGELAKARDNAEAGVGNPGFILYCSKWDYYFYLLGTFRNFALG